MRTKDTLPIEKPTLTHSPQEIQIAELIIDRLEKRKRECFILPNPYYIKGQHPTEWNDLTNKIVELKIIITTKK